MCRIKLQMESLETVSLWKLVKYVKHADLGVIGPAGSLRSVTVERIIVQSVLLGDEIVIEMY